MATMVETRLVKVKQAWTVLQGKLISLGCRDRSTRLALFESYVRSVLLYECSVWGVTKLDRKGKTGVDCTGELWHILGSFLKSILNVNHSIRNSVLYVLSGKPPLSVYITTAVMEFVDSWVNGDSLVVKVAEGHYN